MQSLPLCMLMHRPLLCRVANHKEISEKLKKCRPIPNSVALPTSQLILRHFRCFTYMTVHSTTLLQLLLGHRVFTYVTWRAALAVLSGLIFNIRHMFWSNLLSKFSDNSPKLQLILEPFNRLTYVTADSPTFPLLHLRDSSFSNHSLAYPKSQDLHLRHLASRPCSIVMINLLYQTHVWSN